MTGAAQTLLELSLILALYAAIVSIAGKLKKSELLLRLAFKGGLAVVGLVTIVSVYLFYALIVKDFSIEYVASYTSASTPFFYRITAFWAGQAGSLLFWVLVLAWYTFFSYKKDREHELFPVAFSVLMFVMAFFLIAVTMIKSPFKTIPFKIPDGQGLNPLLQNVGMAYHPPTLFLGYVGLAVPFAYMVSLLTSGRENSYWLSRIRLWLLIPWIFLGIGIVLGAQWAYVELGWGGYWAWDPVENASLLPWLTATAAIHSIYAQRKKGYFRVWNAILICVTFLLSVLGTYLTRSGIVASVHTFGKSLIGTYFFFFIMIIIISIVVLLAKRGSYLRGSERINNLFSREGTILFNNIVFLGMTFAVIWGTFYPLTSKLITGDQVSVGPPFYNRIMIPIGLFMLFLMSISPFIRWSGESLQRLKKQFLVPFGVVLLAFIVMVFMTGWSIYVIISFSLILFALWLIIKDFIDGLRVRKRSGLVGYYESLKRLFGHNRTRYGGHLIHLGILMLYIGLTGSAFNKEFEGKVTIGEKSELGSYLLELVDVRSFRGPNYDAIEASVKVWDGNESIGMLKPEKRLYDKFRDQVRSEVSIITGLARDIYGILVAIDSDSKSATVKILLNPLVIWIWIGAFVLTIGAVIVIVPDKGDKQ